MAFDDRVILTGFEKQHSQGDSVQSKTTENTDEILIEKSKSPRKYHAKSKRKTAVTLATNQSEIENMQIYRTDQPEDKDVFLPRLTGSSSRTSPDNKSQDGHGQQLRLPEIRIVPSNLSRMALNRSITDLLDPEMEILNRIKHGPRKKKKKRRNNTVHQPRDKTDGQIYMS